MIKGYKTNTSNEICYIMYIHSFCPPPLEIEIEVPGGRPWFQHFAAFLGVAFRSDSSAFLRASPNSSASSSRRLFKTTATSRSCWNFSFSTANTWAGIFRLVNWKPPTMISCVSNNVDLGIMYSLCAGSQCSVPVLSSSQAGLKIRLSVEPPVFDLKYCTSRHH